MIDAYVTNKSKKMRAYKERERAKEVTAKEVAERGLALETAK